MIELEQKCPTIEEYECPTAKLKETLNKLGVK